MEFNFQLKQFTGPLDLLLGLIQERKLDISQVALAQVTGQYLRYLDTMTERQPDELADFLVIAARLLLRKARQLLPDMSPEEEEGPSLEEQLRLYQAFVKVSRQIERRWGGSERAVFRLEPPRRPANFAPPENLAKDTLRDIMIQLLRRIEPPLALPLATIEKTISVKEKIDFIRSLLARRKQVSFQELLAGAGSRTEVIVSFLALLELAKQQFVQLRQSEQFGDIAIHRA